MSSWSILPMAWARSRDRRAGDCGLQARVVRHHLRQGQDDAAGSDREDCAVGMRKLAEPAMVKRALETLKGRARIKRTMWSRRAQEYEAKINSGDIVSIAEVVRDFTVRKSQPSNPTASVSSTKPRSIGCRAKSRPCSASPRPKRSRRSRPTLPRGRAAPRQKRRSRRSRKRRPEGRFRRGARRRRSTKRRLSSCCVA